MSRTTLDGRASISRQTSRTEPKRIHTKQCYRIIREHFHEHHLVTFGVCLSPSSAQLRTFISGASASGSRCVPFTATIQTTWSSVRQGSKVPGNMPHPRCLHIDPAARSGTEGEPHPDTLRRGRSALTRERAPRRRPCHRGRRRRGRGGARGARRRQHSRPGGGRAADGGKARTPSTDLQRKSIYDRDNLSMTGRGR